jgi:hypothetical protein
VPEDVVERAIREDKRGDAAKYLRWRTTEAFDARFILSTSR